MRTFKSIIWGTIMICALVLINGCGNDDNPLEKIMSSETSIDYSKARIGDLFYTDGTFSSTLEAGKTPIGVIAYLGTNNYTENGVILRDDKTTLNSHGLVLCLKNIASGGETKWSVDITTWEFGEEAKVDDVASLKRTDNVSGYTNTKTLAYKDNSETNYKAAYAAWNYTALVAPSNTTGWFLPSAQQWVKMVEGLGEISDGAPAMDSWFDENHTGAYKWEAAIKKAGEGNYDTLLSEFICYCSSSEYAKGSTVDFLIDPLDTYIGHGFSFSYSPKDGPNDYFRVRPILAF